ncbi:MAG TPA: hypothetical protein VK425_04505 [Acidimicrobiales bacterium]|nr:hypothetical protein [Acidimicrobiales bacterium]
MARIPRLLCIMGSGETTPTMVKLHRQLFQQMGSRPAVILDTPYGFQSNASDISARAVLYFQQSAGAQVELASLLRAEGASPVALESALARVAAAAWVFCGPGSPTYALRQWRLTSLPRLLADKLANGGCLVFSSAAALTVGHWTVPVYEIYKAGADPSWVEGLNLLSPFGLNVAVIPHYDNAEGGTHDTRYCYLGERRLHYMEGQLPLDGWALGVDEHTACVLDFDKGEATVWGLGSVTLRHLGHELKFMAGAALPLAQLPDLALGRGGGTALAGPSPAEPASVPAQGPAVPSSSGSGAGPPGPRPSPFLSEISRLSSDFDEALARRDPHLATEAVLGLETCLHEWSADTFESDEVDRARAILRRALLRLGEAAGPGMQDRRERVKPWVDALLAERDEARRTGRYTDADRVRDRLAAAGVDVRDTPSGTEWDLRSGA